MTIISGPPLSLSLDLSFFCNDGGYNDDDDLQAALALLCSRSQLLQTTKVITTLMV